MASSSAVSTSFERVTQTSLVPTVTGTTTFVLVDPNAVSERTLTETLRGQTITTAFTVTGATITTTSELVGTATSLIVTSTPVATVFSTLSASSSSSVSSSTASSTASSTSATSSTVSSTATSSSTSSSSLASSLSSSSPTSLPSSSSSSRTSSTAPSSSSRATSAANSSSGASNHLGAIIGGAVGGAVGLLLLGLLFWYCARRKSSAARAEREADFFATPAPHGHGEDAWGPAAVAGAGAGAAAARRSKRMSKRRPEGGFAGGGGGAYDEKDDEGGAGAGFAVLPQKKRLAPADEQDAYYANLPPTPLQRDPSPDAGGAGVGAGMAGIGAGLAGVGAGAGHGGGGGRGGGGGGAGAYPPLGGANFDPRARETQGGWAAAGSPSNSNAQQPFQGSQAYPPYPSSGGGGGGGGGAPYGYPTSQPPQPHDASATSLLPHSIAYNPPRSSFLGPTDLAPPPSSRFAAFQSPSASDPHHPQPPPPQGIGSPTPSYRSIPQLGAISRAESETGGSSASFGGSQAGFGGGGQGGGGRQLRVVNEGDSWGEDPYGGLDEGLTRR